MSQPGIFLPPYQHFRIFPSEQPNFPSVSLQESEGNSSNCREHLLGLGKDCLPSYRQEGFVLFYFFNARLEKSGEGTGIIALLTPWYLISNFALNSSLRQLPSLFPLPRFLLKIDLIVLVHMKRPRLRHFNWLQLKNKRSPFKVKIMTFLPIQITLLIFAPRPDKNAKRCPRQGPCVLLRGLAACHFPDNVPAAVTCGLMGRPQKGTQTGLQSFTAPRTLLLSPRECPRGVCYRLTGFLATLTSH